MTSRGMIPEGSTEAPLLSCWLAPEQNYAFVEFATVEFTAVEFTAAEFT